MQAVHELSICQALIAQVEEIALNHRARKVELVRVRIGPLSGVEASLLQHAYPFASAGTLAAESTLVIDAVAARVKCEACGAESEAEPNRLACGTCGSTLTKVVSGDEMLLMGVELIISGACDVR
ncbi:MAG TPA: hydrogenase maturation nickel metallochaperone HypA [Nitrosospira sp.]